MGAKSARGMLDQNISRVQRFGIEIIRKFDEKHANFTKNVYFWPSDNDLDHDLDLDLED